VQVAAVLGVVGVSGLSFLKASADSYMTTTVLWIK